MRPARVGGEEALFDASRNEAGNLVLRFRFRSARSAYRAVAAMQARRSSRRDPDFERHRVEAGL